MAKFRVWDGSQWIEVKGDKGDQGDQGVPGTAATVSAGTVTTGAAGSEATVSEGGTAQARIFNFTIPRGDKGDTGDTGATGAAATVSVGTTTTGAAGSDAAVTQTGTAQARTFNFAIPRGDQGIQGDQGDTGPNPLHVGTTAPADPTVQRLWLNPSE